jgi:hypothetical protein
MAVIDTRAFSNGNASAANSSPSSRNTLMCNEKILRGENAQPFRLCCILRSQNIFNHPTIPAFPR